MKKRLKKVLKLIRSARILNGESVEFFDLLKRSIGTLATVHLSNCEVDSVRERFFESIKQEIERQLLEEFGPNVIVELTGFNVVDSGEIEDSLSEIASVHGYKFDVFKSPKHWTIETFLIDGFSRQRFNRLLSESVSTKCKIEVLK